MCACLQLRFSPSFFLAVEMEHVKLASFRGSGIWSGKSIIILSLFHSVALKLTPTKKTLWRPKSTKNNRRNFCNSEIKELLANHQQTPGIWRKWTPWWTKPSVWIGNATKAADLLSITSCATTNVKVYMPVKYYLKAGSVNDAQPQRYK